MKLNTNLHKLIKQNLQCGSQLSQEASRLLNSAFCLVSRVSNSQQHAFSPSRSQPHREFSLQVWLGQHSSSTGHSPHSSLVYQVSLGQQETNESHSQSLLISQWSPNSSQQSNSLMQSQSLLVRQTSPLQQSNSDSHGQNLLFSMLLPRCLQHWASGLQSQASFKGHVSPLWAQHSTKESQSSQIRFCLQVWPGQLLSSEGQLQWVGFWSKVWPGQQWSLSLQMQCWLAGHRSLSVEIRHLTLNRVLVSF
jgi:hypothetical protein